MQDNIVNNNINDKDVIGDVFYLNGSVMTMRRAAIFDKGEKLSFTWLGDETIPIIQDSICMEIDTMWQTNIIEKIDFGLDGNHRENILYGE